MDSNEQLSRSETGFRKFVLEEIIHINRNEDHLPIPVYSYLKPTLGVQFIHHVMLSLGRFATEIDLTMHPTIRDSLRYAKLIGPSNNLHLVRPWTGGCHACEHSCETAGGVCDEKKEV